MSTPRDSGSGAGGGPRSIASGGALSRVRTPSSTPSEPTPTTATDGQAGTDNTVIEIEDDAQVGCKRKLKSDVWNDFDKIVVNGVAKGRCHWCKKELSATVRSGTSHLCSHLTRRICVVIISSHVLEIYTMSIVPMCDAFSCVGNLYNEGYECMTV
jgi:hypothetical protein